MNLRPSIRMDRHRLALAISLAVALGVRGLGASATVHGVGAALGRMNTRAPGALLHLLGWRSRSHRRCPHPLSWLSLSGRLQLSPTDSLVKWVGEIEHPPIAMLPS